MNSCNQSSDGTCRELCLLWRCFSWLILTLAATANTIAASGRSRRVRRDVDCDFPYTKCAIPGLEDSHECVDVQSNIESCGGCVGAGGMDCTSINKALAADCMLGSCVIRMFPHALVQAGRTLMSSS